MQHNLYCATKIVQSIRKYTMIYNIYSIFVGQQTGTYMRIKAALFDFDGVIADTEPLYNTFWDEMGKRHHIENPDFSSAIKGTTLTGIIETFFKDRTEDEKKCIIQESESYDINMPFYPVHGSLEFLQTLKKENVPLALVTSSGNNKLIQAFKQLSLDGIFDTIVSADRITQGKPNPMCYLLAAKDLDVDPDDCLVFEDSFAGIEAANRAGMRVIALSTTNKTDQLVDKAYKVIPDFSKLSFDDYMEMCK